MCCPKASPHDYMCDSGSGSTGHIKKYHNKSTHEGCFYCDMPPTGVEPVSPDPQSSVLSIERRGLMNLRNYAIYPTILRVVNQWLFYFVFIKSFKQK